MNKIRRFLWGTKRPQLNVGKIVNLFAVNIEITGSINNGIIHVDQLFCLTEGYAIAIKLPADVNRSQTFNMGATVVLYGFCADFYAIGALNDRVFSVLRKDFVLMATCAP
ncbi:hypothetical protein [Cardiobacterium hominis]|uniref:hypothetical protein n=1 Tax=Cardiobacterium hominis TaxID=2718 RepID=UPI000F819EE1|nr:hypothetical protein [Cardiobacterium hominis]